MPDPINFSLDGNEAGGQDDDSYCPDGQDTIHNENAMGDVLTPIATSNAPQSRAVLPAEQSQQYRPPAPDPFAPSRSQSYLSDDPVTQANQMAAIAQANVVKANASAAAASAASKQSRNKKIKIAAGLIGAATASYYLYKYYKGEDNVVSSTLDKVKSILGVKSNPPRRRAKKSPGSGFDYFKKKRVKTKRRAVKRRVVKRNEPVYDEDDGNDVDDYDNGNSDDDSYNDDDGSATCHVVDCGEPCKKNKPYCSEHYDELKS